MDQRLTLSNAHRDRMLTALVACRRGCPASLAMSRKKGNEGSLGQHSNTKWRGRLLACGEARW